MILISEEALFLVYINGRFGWDAKNYMILFNPSKAGLFGHDYNIPKHFIVNEISS